MIGLGFLERRMGCPERSIIAWLVILLAPLAARAGFELPTAVYRMDRLPRALAEARAKEKPLAFVQSDEGTTCPKCRAATLEAFQLLVDQCVVVYIGPGEGAQLPALVTAGLRSPEAGRFIPRAVVVDPQLSRIIAVIPYAGLPKRVEILAEAQTLILEYQQQTARQKHAPATDPVDAGPEAVPDDPPPLPAAPEAKQAAAPPPAKVNNPTVVLRWQGRLQPSPKEKLSGFFKTEKLPFEILRQDQAGCTFRIKGAVVGEDFLVKLQVFLNQSFQVERLDVEGGQTTAVLGPLQP
jgi:hypothetical protein